MTKTNDLSVSFSGSGFLIFAHCGAACALEDLGKNIREVSGSSGGSIISSLLAIGLTSEQIRHLAFSTDLTKFITFDPTALFSRGLCYGDRLNNWLRQTLGPTTFAQAKIPTRILATDLEAGGIFCFSPETTPNALLAEACRCSASVPFVYVPAQYNGRIYLDGGMCDNLPLNFLTLPDTQRIALQVQSGSSAASVSSLLDFSKQMINTMLSASEQNMVAFGKATGTEIIPINASDFGFLNTNLTLAQKQTLFQRGYDAVTAFYSAAS